MTLQQRLIKLSDEQEWNRALLNVPHGFAHTHWYNQAMHLASQREIVLYHGQTNDFSVICPLSLRRKDANDEFDITTPYGYSGIMMRGEYSQFDHEWHEFMRVNQFVCGHIALHPLYSNTSNFWQDEHVYEGNKCFYIDLTQSMETIEKNLSSDHRHRLRQFYKSGLTVSTEKNSELISAFIYLYENGLQTRQAAAIYNFGESAWRKILLSDAAHLFSVTLNNEIAAVAVFILHDDIADYYMISSTHSGRAYARPIIMEAIKYFKEKSIHWLSLGCGIKQNDDLEKFKAHFGGEAFATRALKQIYNFSAYEALCQRYQVDSAQISGYFPPYWASIK